jgi:Ca-activated chloride channel family protein
VGVGLAYDERFLSTISAASNGEHHFVQNDAGLPALFEAAAKSFASTVASEVRAQIDLGQGVELIQVMDRSFERSGQRVTVPLGSLSRGETKTVLLKVRVPESESVSTTVADIQVLYDDHVRSTEGRTRGKLEVAQFRAGLSPAELDPFVVERVERSRTGALLKEANDLLRGGKADEARRKLSERAKELDALAETLPKAAAGDGRRADIDRQFQAQRRITARAKSDLKPRPAPPGAAASAQPAPVEVQPSLKQNEVDAFQSTR